jgi:hypothetical protein
MKFPGLLWGGGKQAVQRGGHVISDFTVLAVGTKAEGGVVRVCPKCGRNGLHVDMDGHGFYTHFQIFSKDDPRNLFLRRVECHVTSDDACQKHPIAALPQPSRPSSRI